MNGLLCATITATLGQEGNGQRSTQRHPARKTREGAEKLLRNARIRAKDKESESHSKELYPFSSPLKKYRNPIKRPRCWKELMEVSAGVSLLR